MKDVFPRLIVVIAYAFFSVAAGTADDSLLQGAGTLAPVRNPTDSRSQVPAGFFPILPFNASGAKEVMDPDLGRKGDLENIAACNFTMADFVRPADLPLCETLGLPAFVTFQVSHAARTGKAWETLTDAEIEQGTRTLAEKTAGSKSVLGYYLADEPGVTEFPRLAKAVSAIRRYAPGKLAFINLFPNYASLGVPGKSQTGAASYAEYLEQFVSVVKPDLLCYDNYIVQASLDMRDTPKATLYYTNLLEVRRVALKYDLPFWTVVLSDQIRPDTTIPSPANLMFQAYTSLAAGAKGIMWYTFFGLSYSYAPIDEAGHKTPTWPYLQMTNRHLRTIGPIMARLKSTGVFFTWPAPAEGAPILPGKLIRSIESQTPVMVGEFAGDGGTDYVMVVNLSLEKSAKLLIKTQRDYHRREVVSPEEGQPLPLDDEDDLVMDAEFKAKYAPKGLGLNYPDGLWLTPGQGLLIRFAR